LSFDSFSLPSTVLSNISKLGFTAPTPIQTRAVPLGIQGRDLMGLAQTGTGKTAAFLLPILTRLMAGKPAGNKRRARALILAPTRELAEQIHESAIDLSKNTGLRSTTVYGGVNMNRQITALRNGVDIIVACPGRLLDHMGQRTVDLGAVEVLVLDEADQMFDMGFLPDIKKVLAGLPAERQTMLFSATMPDAIKSLASEILRQPETVSVGHSAPAETVSHAIYPVSQHLKTPLLMDMLDSFGDKGSVLVFTRTKHRAKRVAEQLAKAGHAATALQGNLSQNRRKEAMDGFRDGRFRVMVATDIAARGIDVSLVSNVVNYDVPTTPEIYTHRIGRTGRAERTGEAHTFVCGEDMSMVRAIERLLREPLKRKKLEGFDYDMPAPRRDTEFARPPLPPRGGRGVAGAKPYGAKPYGSKQGGGQAYGGQPARPEAERFDRAERSEGRSERRDARGEGRGEFRRDDRPRSERPQGERPQRQEAGQREERREDRRDVRGEARGEFRRDDRPRQDRAAKPARSGGDFRDGVRRDGVRRDGAPRDARPGRPESAKPRDEHGDVNGNRPQPGDDIYANESVGGLFNRRYRYGAPRTDAKGAVKGGARQGR
jgi:ATP-dependent RNA helicase RhlE